MWANALPGGALRSPGAFPILYLVFKVVRTEGVQVSAIHSIHGHFCKKKKNQLERNIFCSLQFFVTRFTRAESMHRMSPRMPEVLDY